MRGAAPALAPGPPPPGSSPSHVFSVHCIHPTCIHHEHARNMPGRCLNDITFTLSFSLVPARCCRDWPSPLSPLRLCVSLPVSLSMVRSERQCVLCKNGRLTARASNRTKCREGLEWSAAGSCCCRVPTGQGCTQLRTARHFCMLPRPAPAGTRACLPAVAGCRLPARRR